MLGNSTQGQLYIATDGNDAWSGELAAPNADKTDGPLATLDMARLKVRALIEHDSSQPINVMIRGGEYEIDSTVVFTHEDSGSEKAPVIYRAYTGEKPVFTGAKKLTGWKKVTDDPKGISNQAKGNLWYCDVPSVEGKWRITSLYDGTKMLQRSKSSPFRVSEEHKVDRWNAQPKDVRGLLNSWEGSPVVFDRVITYNDDDLKDWANITDIEIFMRPKHGWLMNLLPLESIDPASKTATFTVEPTYGFRTKTRYHVENALDHLDQPGEWSFNSLEGRVYLWPKTPLADADIRAPYLQEFIRVEGVEDGPSAKHLSFQGLTFRHGLRDTWEPGDLGLQHDWEMYDKGNAIMRFRHAEHSEVRDCVFEASSGTGVRLDLHCQYITVADNIFANLGGTGILLSGYAPGTKDVSKFNTITNNYIHHVGSIYLHSPGIFVAQSGHNTITHNTIHDLAYNGIVISGCRPHELAYYDILKNRREWVSSLRGEEIKPHVEKIKKGLQKVWLNSDISIFEELLHARENRIAYNEIYRVMLRLHDGNGIYFSGMGKNNVAEYNYIHDVIKNRGFIRLDDNSGYTYIRNNVFVGGDIMMITKWDGEYRNNFAIDAKFVTNREWYPTKMDQVIFYNSGEAPAELAWEENWSTVEGLKLSDNVAAVNSIFFSKGRVEEFQPGQEILAKEKRAGEVGMLFVDPMFDKDAMENKIFRFKPGSPAIQLGIQPLDLSKVGSTLAPDSD